MLYMYIGNIEVQVHGGMQFITLTFFFQKNKKFYICVSVYNWKDRRGLGQCQIDIPNNSHASKTIATPQNKRYASKTIAYTNCCIYMNK